MDTAGIGDQLQDRPPIIGVKRFTGLRTQLVDPDPGVHGGKMLVEIAGIEGPEIRGLLAQRIGDPEILFRLQQVRPSGPGGDHRRFDRRERQPLLAVQIDVEPLGHRSSPLLRGEASAVPKEFPPCRRSLSRRCTGMEPHAQCMSEFIEPRATSSLPTRRSRRRCATRRRPCGAQRATDHRRERPRFTATEVHPESWRALRDSNPRPTA